VILHQSHDLPEPSAYVRWAVLSARRVPDLDRSRERHGITLALEDAFHRVAPEWLRLARALGEERSAVLAHAPSCAANVSDLGEIMAWTLVIECWAAESETTLVVCDDPWLFRHLALRPAGSAGRRPALWPTAVKFALRGYAARTKVSGLALLARLRLHSQRTHARRGGPRILAYGHPASTAGGDDGYFGRLMGDMPDLGRVLHVDCRAALAASLSADLRTVSLHAFGSITTTLGLPLARWRPAARHRNGPHGWLVRRAAAREAATGQAAMVRWQIACQERWLEETRPSVVAWPWENHGWERAFVRAARRRGVRTVGYQHTTVARQELNVSPQSNPDGEAGLPDVIACTGPAMCDRLERRGIPKERLRVVGALRFAPPGAKRPRHDPDGPVYVALPFDSAIAGEMVTAIYALAHANRRFLVKDHPMTPFRFADTDGVRRTDTPLPQCETGLCAVVYAGTAVGLEAILLGLPTVRFLPKAKIAVDVLPDGADAPTADASTLGAALARPKSPAPIARHTVFAPVDTAFWREELRA
jgi:hypothetical protein